MKRLFFVLLMFGMVLSACGTNADMSRCVPASEAQMRLLADSVKNTKLTNNISSGWAVKSNDVENLWFVAAGITGPGINAGQAIGVWAIYGDAQNPGTIYSINGPATQYTKFGVGTGAQPILTLSNDGANEALACATKK